MRIVATAAGAAVLLLVAAPARAAFMVEAHPTGLATANFTSTGHSLSSAPSLAPGVTATGSVFGNPGAAPDIYTFTYTPGVDVDNVSFTIGTVLGDTFATDADGAGPTAPVYTTAAGSIVSSGAAGGITELYNVFITWPGSTNVNPAGSLITIDSNLPDIDLNPVNQNTDQTETPTTPPTPTDDPPFGGNNRWLKIASGVPLSAGTSYTLTMTANAATFVSQRVHGVMWEPIPEPSSLALLGMAGLGLLRRRRA